MKTFIFFRTQIHFQVYWPTIVFKCQPKGKGTDFTIMADNRFRIAWSPFGQRLYCGIGFQILGLGVGVDYLQNVKPL